MSAVEGLVALLLSAGLVIFDDELSVLSVLPLPVVLLPQAAKIMAVAATVSIKVIFFMVYFFGADKKTMPRHSLCGSNNLFLMDAMSFMGAYRPIPSCMFAACINRLANLFASVTPLCCLFYPQCSVCKTFGMHIACIDPQTRYTFFEP